MKKVLILATVLVLTLSVLTGCGCTRQDAGMNTKPSTEMTILPTNIPETTAPLLPETAPATIPMTEGSAGNGNNSGSADNGDSAVNGGTTESGSSAETGSTGAESGSTDETGSARSRMK